MPGREPISQSRSTAPARTRRSLSGLLGLGLPLRVIISPLKVVYLRSVVVLPVRSCRSWSRPRSAALVARLGGPGGLHRVRPGLLAFLPARWIRRRRHRPPGTPRDDVLVGREHPDGRDVDGSRDRGIGTVPRRHRRDPRSGPCVFDRVVGRGGRRRGCRCGCQRLHPADRDHHRPDRVAPAGCGTAQRWPDLRIGCSGTTSPRAIHPVHASGHHRRRGGQIQRRTAVQSLHRHRIEPRHQPARRAPITATHAVPPGRTRRSFER
jgi:hypothetical protein